MFTKSYRKFGTSVVLASIALLSIFAAFSELSLHADDTSVAGASPNFPTAEALISKVDGISAQDGPAGMAMLASGAGACSQEVRFIHDHLEDYRRAAWRAGPAFPKSSAVAEASAALLQENLLALHDKGDPCFQSAAMAYVLGVTAMLEPNGRRIISNYALFLDSRHKIVAVEPSDYKEYVPATRAGKTGDIMGWYDCGSETIYLNVSLPPLNLAGAFSHELSHLLRDKFNPIKPAELDLKSWVLFDETLATLFGGYKQFALASPPANMTRFEEDLLYPNQDPIELMPATEELTHYQLSGDNNLFSKHGFIAKTIGMDVVNHFAYFGAMAHTTILPCYHDPSSTGWFLQQRKNLSNLYAMVMKVYFGEPFEGEQETELLSSTPLPNICTQFEPFHSCPVRLNKPEAKLV